LGVDKLMTGWGEVRTPTFCGGGDYVGVPSSPQPTIAWWVVLAMGAFGRGYRD
jgi:hypothetical protein